LTSSEYGAFTWPSAYVLAEYLWHLNKEGLEGRQILELGCGTGLAGLVAAACGASVLFTDDQSSDLVLKNTKISLMTNNPVKWTLQTLKNETEMVDHKVEHIFLSTSKVIPFTWGCFSPQLLLEYQQRTWPDMLIAADCFYDNESDHNSVFATLSYFFLKNPLCKFLLTHQVRSSNNKLQRLVQTWGFQCRQIPLDGSISSDFAFPHEKYSLLPEIRLFEISPS
jgi:predicted nicotinamide N-methyase